MQKNVLLFVVNRYRYVFTGQQILWKVFEHPKWDQIRIQQKGPDPEDPQHSCLMLLCLAAEMCR
jgi:hypothetical protein